MNAILKFFTLAADVDYVSCGIVEMKQPVYGLIREWNIANINVEMVNINALNFII